MEKYYSEELVISSQQWRGWRKMETKHLVINDIRLHPKIHINVRKEKIITAIEAENEKEPRVVSLMLMSEDNIFDINTKNILKSSNFFSAQECFL